MCCALSVWNSATARAADSVDVPAIVSLTGLASFIGNQDKVTLGLGEKLINESGGVKGCPLHFVYQDDQSNPQVAVQLLNQIVAAKPSVIVGPNLSATCNAVAPLLTSGPADYCLSPALTPEVGGYVFSTMTSTRDAIGAQIRYFRMKGWTRVALLSSTDATGQGRWAGYCGQVTQMAFLGAPPAVFHELGTILSDALHGCLAKMRPGITLGELADTTEAIARGSAYQISFLMHSRGLGDGAPIYVFNAADAVRAQIIVANTVFVVKPVVKPSKGWHPLVCWGDSVVVTESGARRLGSLPLGIEVIG
jgi:hypothetical protein